MSFQYGSRRRDKTNLVKLLAHALLLIFGHVLVLHEERRAAGDGLEELDKVPDPCRDPAIQSIKTLESVQDYPGASGCCSCPGGGR